MNIVKLIYKNYREFTGLTVLGLVYLFGYNQQIQLALFALNSYSIAMVFFILKNIITKQKTNKDFQKPIMLIPFVIVIVLLWFYLDQDILSISIVLASLFILVGIGIQGLLKTTNR